MNKGAPIFIAGAALFACLGADRGVVDWADWGGDAGATHYSSLSEINKTNVTKLKQAWIWKTGEAPLAEYKTRPGMFEDTPLMIDGVVYVTTPYNRVVALDAKSGKELWAYDPKTYADGQPPNGTGYVHRGIAVWRSGGDPRIFLNTRYRLISIDAKTGKPDASFGDNGVVDLSQGLVWPINKMHYTETSPPVVYKNLVIVGNGVGDRLTYKNDPPGDVRAFDARTGKRVWTFHTIPQPGEPGAESWGQGSNKFTGHTNVWAPMSLDERRGLLYLPVSTPSNDFYGGARPGNNLYADSIVCLDANTGQRKWFYQLVHHGLWDYDMASPPALVTINVEGRKIDAVVQLTKQGFAFVFDRVTGVPVWPIEERPVPASDVPGEQASPTQPFPTKPPAFSPQGVTLDDAFDLTPELKAEAQQEMKKYRLGGLFTPPSLQGTLGRPGIIGGANWGGGAFDPETGMLYIKTTNSPAVWKIVKAEHTSEVDAEWTGDLRAQATFQGRLPLTKPPYGQVTAIDLNQGTIAWQEPFGDWPELRKNPALAGVELPRQLGVGGPQGGIVTKGGLFFVGGEDRALHAIDKATGRDLWQGALPGRAYGVPMTYRARDGKQFVVIAAGQGADAALVAFSIGAN
ncbi:MAG TPA: pyrroloquinoline quinone-dependent dehydrogenase [Bryobacteraceae bacterium]|nr:pyrroloquinoline quinone-dependent dehydrogenase [Bryobacteraceae bacterium]